MKATAISTIVSLATIIISICLICISYIFDRNTSAVILNIGIGVLGSGVVSFVMTFSEYFVEKRLAQEKYYNVANKIINCFYKIEYIPISEESKLIAAYNYERQGDEWRTELGVDLETVHFRNLCNYYNSQNFLGYSDYAINEVKTRQIVDVRSERIKCDIENAMRSYIAIDSVSLEEFENAYGNLFYIRDLFSCKTNKRRTNIYLTIHSRIRDMHRFITEQNYHFNMYFSAQNGNMPIMVDKVEYCNNHLFLVEFISENQTVIWAKWYDDIFEILEKFRCDIYKDEYVKIKSYPIKSYFNGIPEK